MSVIKNIETYTYLDEIDNIKPLEVILIGVDAQKIGSENSFEPKGFFREHITTWLKEKYFFLDGNVYAQVPKQFKHYPDIVVDKFETESAYISDITFNDKGIIHIYYVISSSEAICLSWDIRINHWSMSFVSQPSENGNIITEKGHNTGNKLFWSN